MRRVFSIAGVLNYIVVIFLNAFTDLGHKIIIQNTIFKVYDGELQIILTALINAMILLPFILVFSPAGFLSDRYAKSKIMEYASVFAIIITLGITFSYYQGWFLSAFALTFLLALQSALYSPAKYGYIKELVGVEHISEGNALVQATTTVAILSGIIFYTLLFESILGENFTTKEDVLKVVAPLGWLLVVGSIIEWFLASKLPNKMQEASSRDFRLKRYLNGSYLRKNLHIIKRKREIFEAIIALSLFWSISQVVLAIFGEYAKSQLGITNTIMVQGVMALAGIGIVAGSLMAASYSRYYINTGIATIGAMGIALIVLCVPFSTSMPLLASLFTLFGIFSGFIMVPLNATIQALSPRVHLGTVLAGSNYIQNIFMFSFLMLTTLFAYFGMNAEVLFYLMACTGIYLSYMLLRRYDVMTFWAFFEVLLKLRYKFVVQGLENVPHATPLLLLGNHVSWLDWFIVQLPLQRRINFLMDKDIYHKKLFNRVLKKGHVIPISQRGFKDGVLEAAKRLQENNIVVIFPEGEIAHSEDLGVFHKGYEIIANHSKGKIVPFFIDGMAGSFFARNKENRKSSFFSRREVYLAFGAPLRMETKAEEVQKIVQQLKDNREIK